MSETTAIVTRQRQNLGAEINRHSPKEEIIKTISRKRPGMKFLKNIRPKELRKVAAPKQMV